MILTPHFLVGAALATKIQPLALAVILAICSHYILDAVPHWDYSTLYIRKKQWKKSLPVFLKIALDFSLGLLIISLLAKNWFLIIVGGFFAVLPDAVTFITIILPKSKPLEMHHFFHDRICHWFRDKKISLFWKIFNQLAVVFLIVWLLL